MQRYTVYFIWKLLYMFRVVPPSIIRSANKCIYLPLAADSSNGVTNTRCCRCSLCAPDDGWRYHPKHVEQFPDINKLCKVASCWIYIGIYLRCTEP